MKLMIVESPNKTKKIREALSNIRPGENWRVEASVGHIRDLPQSGQNEDEITSGIRTDYMPRYVLTEQGSKQVTKLAALASQAQEVYLATDPDREGESISWHLKMALKLDNPIRVAFNEITESRIGEALNNPRRIDMKLVGAQEARRSLDRLVGYLVSPALSRRLGERLSAGRVQSVAVYLVVLREREIRNFKPTTHYTARLFFAGAKMGERWGVQWMTSDGFVSEEDPYFLDRRFAELVSRVRDVVVQSCEEKNAERNPPGPFTSSTLQQAASIALKWRPASTMAVAQELFSQGLISYHRTDNPNVTDEDLEEIRAVAGALGLAVVANRRKFKGAVGAQEGHSGITPTHWETEVAGENAEQQALYRLIRTRAIASQLLAAEYAVRTVILQGVDKVEGKTVRFGAVGRELLSQGWLKFMAGDDTEENDEDEAGDAGGAIPRLQPGTLLTAQEGELVESKTRAAKRYTQASLLRALEVLGIGRPATMASIMNTIHDVRGYVVEDKKRQLSPSEIGELTIKGLEGNFAFLDPDFTREMESDLDLIAEGKQQYRAVVERLHKGLEAELVAMASAPSLATVYPCPECESPMRRISGAKGHFWGCTKHPECNGTLPDERGKPGKRAEESEHKCGDCGSGLVRRQKKGKDGYDFWGCSGFKVGCKVTYPNLKGKGKPDYHNVKRR